MSANPFAGSAFAEEEDKEVPTTTEEEEECGAGEETLAQEEGSDNENQQPEDGEDYEAEEVHQEGDNEQQQEDGDIQNEGDIAEEGGGGDFEVQEEDDNSEAVARTQEAVEECADNATEEFSAELFVSIQAQLAESQASNAALTNSHSIVAAKLESTEKELQLVKDTLSQLQQLMASTAALAGTTTATTDETTPTTDAVEVAAIPSFDAVELALELEVTDRKLIKALHDAEASALLASKWKEESERYAGMYHEAVGGRYIPLLSDHGAAIIQQTEGGVGSKVFSYFSDLLRGNITTPSTTDGDGDTTATFSKPQREMLLDYILACGYELQFMMMRTHINDIHLRRRTNEIDVATTKAQIGEKRVRSDDTTPTTSSSAGSSNTIATSVKQGLLEELIQELSSAPSPSGSSKWDLSKTQLTPASTATINALRAHVTKFDQLERTVQTQEKMLESARSLSANPLFELAWDDKIVNNTTTSEGSTGTIISEEELAMLKGRNKLLTGACRMYYRRSQQLLLELANKNATAVSASSMGAIVAGGAVSSAEIVAAYSEGMDALRRSYISTLEEVALGVSSKLATLTSLHNKFVLGVNNRVDDDEEEEDEGDDAEKPEANNDNEDAGLSELSNTLISSLQSFVEAGHNTMAALKEAVITTINTHLAGPLNAASIQHDRDVAVFAQLFSEADAVIVDNIFSQEEEEGGREKLVDVEHFRALMTAILHRTPTVVPTVALPTNLTTLTTTTPSSCPDVANLIQIAASQCAATMLSSHDESVKSNAHRTDFVTSKVASLLVASGGDGNGAALLLKELQGYQSAHRTLSTELTTTSTQLKVARSKLEEAQKQHAAVKADYEKEAKAHAEVSILLRESQDNLSKKTTLSQTELAELKSQYEAQIATLNSTIQQHQEEYTALEEKLAEAVASAAAAVAEAEVAEEEEGEVAAVVEETAEYGEEAADVNNNDGDDDHQGEEEAEVAAGDVEEEQAAINNNVGDNEEENNNDEEAVQEEENEEGDNEEEEGEEYDEEAEGEEEEEEAEGTIF